MGMNETLGQWREYWLTAWRLLTGQDLGPRGSMVLAGALRWLPAAGLGVGLVLWLLAELLIALFNPPLAALLGAFLLPILFNILTQGRSLRAVMQIRQEFQTGAASGQAHWPLVVLQLIFTAKALAFAALIFTDHALWLILPPLLASAAYSEMLSQQGVPDEEGSALPIHWCIAGAITLAAAWYLEHFFWGLVTLALSWILVPFATGLLKGRLGGLNRNACLAVTESVEILVLILGMLVFYRL
jgi:hypothetical protein